MPIKSEKLLATCRSAVPFRPRACYGLTLAGASHITVRAWRSSGGTVRQTELAPDATVPPAPRLRRAGPPEARHGESGCAASPTVGCLAVQESLTLWLNSSLTSRAKAEKVLPSLLDIQLPFPLEDCVYQFVEYRRTSAGTVSALVCAARREAIQGCLARYQARGQDPMFLDHEGLALWTQSLLECPARPPASAVPKALRAGNAIRHRRIAGGPVEDGRQRGLICLESDHITVVVGSGARYGNAHSLQTPAQTIRQASLMMACHEQASPESAEGRSASNGDLVNRLQLLLHPDFPTGSEVQWLFCGARAGETAMVQTLHQALRQMWPGPLTIHKDPASFLSRALCERALKRGPLRCNLRQLSFTHPTVQRAVERSARVAAVTILVAGVLLLGFSLTSRLLVERRLNRLKAEITVLARELAPGAVIPYGREVAEVQKAWEKRSPLTKPFLDAFAPSLAVRLAEVVRAGQASAVRFESLSLRRNSLALTGLAEDWDQCGQLEQRLAALGYVVKLERQEAVAEAVVRFTVKAEGGGE